MKHSVKMLAGLIALMALMSCAPGYESKGDMAYKASQNAVGDDKRVLQKEAYMYYHKAIQAHPDKINNRLRNHYIEMVLNRVSMVLTEGTSQMDAIPLFMQEIDSVLTQDVNPSLRTSYVTFLLQLADSNLNNQKIYKGLSLVDKAQSIAVDQAIVKNKKDEITRNLAKTNFEIAQVEAQAAAENKDAEAMVRAEYHVKLAMHYQQDYPEAADLLSKLRIANRNTYSAYKAVIIDRPDTSIFRAIDEFDILLAIPFIKEGAYQVDMYNYSYNPLRLRASDFYLVDENGNRSAALGSSKIDKEILEQEREIRMHLRFPGVSGKVKKLIYETPDKAYYSEKYFF
jgi:hypothetical protein